MAKDSEYEQVYSGDWWPLASSFQLACCHCHLVHNVYIKKKGGGYFIRLDENARATAALRRHHDVPIRHKPRKRAKRGQQ